MFRSPFDSFIPIDYDFGQRILNNNNSPRYAIEEEPCQRILNNNNSSRYAIEEEPCQRILNNNNSPRYAIDYDSGQRIPNNSNSSRYAIDYDSGQRIPNNNNSSRYAIEEEPCRTKPETHDEEKRKCGPVNVVVRFESPDCCCEKCCDEHRNCCDRCCDEHRNCCDRCCCDGCCRDGCCCDGCCRDGCCRDGCCRDGCCRDRYCCDRCCRDRCCCDRCCCDRCCCDRCCCCDPCGSALNSATGSAGPLPIIAALTTPIPVVSVTIDTRCICNPSVLLNFSTALSLPAASATTLVFQVLRSGPCNGASVPVGSTFTYTNTVVAATSDTFSFQVFDSSLTRGTYTYSVVLTTGTTATVAGVTLINSTLSASAGNS